MVSIRGYLSDSFTKALLIVFLPIYTIISLSYLIRISMLTEKVSMGFAELLQLYSYSIPEILFYTLPFSFVVALANLFSKLSQDNELIALFALGLNSQRLLQGIWIIALLFTVLLLAISFVTVPLSMQKYKAFKEEIKANATVQLSEGVLGQKFGDYYVYVDHKNREEMKDLVIYKQNPDEKEQFFTASKGELVNKDGSISLVLHEGYGYTYDENKLQEAQYETLTASQSIKAREVSLDNIPEYWAAALDDKRRAKKAIFAFFISLIPLLSLYLVAAFTIVNPRYQSSNTTASTFMVTVLLYGLASFLQRQGDIVSITVFILSLFVTGHWIFSKRVARFF